MEHSIYDTTEMTSQISDHEMAILLTAGNHNFFKIKKEVNMCDKLTTPSGGEPGSFPGKVFG